MVQPDRSRRSFVTSAGTLPRRARDAGYEGTGHWKAFSDLKSLWERDDFKRLLAEGDLPKPKPSDEKGK